MANFLKLHNRNEKEICSAKEQVSFLLMEMPMEWVS
ncbi:hypothetical protein DJ90_6429 [Paenibacillus macerans]|uniref:Uncharacterized protein n=1 Tax=Paenibacillus macerans TaxID=44252 RepID=A0A091A564_PAEMA|nr:hypothetical protein DJ90_6429 [Paenibacillus macerans]